MAALDPTQEPEADEEGNLPNVPRSTLRIIKQRPMGDDEDLDSDEEDDDYLQALLGNGSDDDEEDEDDDEDDEPNGGPSDPAKFKKARAEASLKKLIEAAQEEDSDEDMEDGDAKPNGIKSKKGKEVALDEDDEEDSDDDSEDMGMDMEQFVVCTLDTERVRFHLSTGQLADH